MEFTQVIRDRYSCKKFDGRPVAQKQLDAILEAGRLAPTAKKPAGAENLCGAEPGRAGQN